MNRARTNWIFSCIVIVSLFMISGCLEESDVDKLVKIMNEKANSVQDYEAVVSFSQLVSDGTIQKTTEAIWIFKKPDKSKMEYIFPQRRAGDIDLMVENKQWLYSAAKDLAYEMKPTGISAEQMLETPDFYSIISTLLKEADTTILYEDSAIIADITFKSDTQGSGRIKIWFDSDTYTISKIERYNPKNIDHLITRIEFKEIQVNQNIQDSEFKLPPGTQTIKVDDMIWPPKKSIEEMSGAVPFDLLLPKESLQCDGAIFDFFEGKIRLEQDNDLAAVLYYKATCSDADRYFYIIETKDPTILYLDKVWEAPTGPDGRVKPIETMNLNGNRAEFTERWVQVSNGVNFIRSVYWQDGEYFLIVATSATGCGILSIEGVVCPTGALDNTMVERVQSQFAPMMVTKEDLIEIAQSLEVSVLALQPLQD